MARALQLDWHLTKDEVLELYLTLAPFGGNLEGVRAASFAWFGKEPKRLTVGEAALLVALPQSPERRRPDRRPEIAKAARDRVIATLAERGVITPNEAKEAMEEPIPDRRRRFPFHAPHLAQDLLAQVKARSPEFFENLVVDLLVRMGYGGSRKEAGQRIGKAGDGGIDGIIKEDKLGLDFVYIQAKRWEGAVSRPTVQAFAGSLEGHRARKGVLITTSRFTDEAQQYVRNIEKRIVLIDGDQLAQYMIDHNVGVAEVASYTVKRVALEELDYYDESSISVATPTPTVEETGSAV